ncbi:hypothetical protein CDAR_411981 [Caerostris darwini]|uniref:Secreted protein n=1 Tax=Caerostris darwini TaxID=1538125 RepID=A0AAV4WC45_9ARAC|nr:hypothetical protein CDAR_411981 [Caerostris darwini]
MLRMRSCGEGCLFPKFVFWVGTLVHAGRCPSSYAICLASFGTRVAACQLDKQLSWCIAYSRDINSDDFYLWCHVKNLTYKKKPTDLHNIERSVNDAFSKKFLYL